MGTIMNFQPTKPLNRRAILKGMGATALGASSLPLFNIGARAADGVLKIGYIASLSGVRANFGEADQWNVENMVKPAVAKGLQINGKTYDVEILVRDSQSNMNRSTSVGNELLLREKVDLLLIQDSDAARALGALADTAKVPTISTMEPWQAWYDGRKGSPETGFPYTFHFFWGVDDLFTNYFSAWDSVETNRKVGTFYIDVTAGHGFSGAIGAGLKANNYEEIAGGFFKIATDDFSNQVAAFKNGDADIVTGLAYSDHFSTFWNQAAQQGFQPEVATVAAAFLFPSAIATLGSRGNGMSTEVWWTPDFPFSSSLSGISARQLADKWEGSTGKQWTQPLGYGHALWEIGLKALQQSADPKDRDAVRDSIAKLNFETVLGPVDFAGSKIKNVAQTNMAFGQWRKNADGAKFPFDLKVTHNPTASMITVAEQFKLLSQLA